MADIFALIVAHAARAQDEPAFRAAVEAHVQQQRAGSGSDHREPIRRSVSAAEGVARASGPGAFTFDAGGFATLAVEGRAYGAGRFETHTIGELRERCLGSARAGGARPQIRVWVLDGGGPATDIGALQACSARGTLFQVASQFNCLESPGPYLTDVVNYFHDHTQGPRASVSAFPATLLRHYAAPGLDGTRFVQRTGGPQVELLADVLGAGAAPDGYLNGEGVADPAAVPALLAERFEQIRVGVHEGAEVVLGYDWHGGVPPGAAPIAQVFTSTVAAGGYGGERYWRHEFNDVCGPLLRAAYLGTLLAAASLGRPRVSLTLIGGGVFGNPLSLILDAMRWAVDEAEPLLTGDLDVFVNGYNLGSRVNLEAQVLPWVRARGGAVVRFGDEGLVSISR